VQLPIIQQVVEWQSRPLDAGCPIVCLDCIVSKIRHDQRYRVAQQRDSQSNQETKTVFNG